MKRISFLFAIVAISGLIFTTSCSEDDCTPPALEENIVGTWTLNGSSVEFRANGTLIDPDDALIGGESNGVTFDDKTYQVLDDMTVTARASGGTQFIQLEFDVPEYECDSVTFRVFGVSVTMTRD